MGVVWRGEMNVVAWLARFVSAPMEALLTCMDTPWRYDLPVGQIALKFGF